MKANKKTQGLQGFKIMAGDLAKTAAALRARVPGKYNPEQVSGSRNDIEIDLVDSPMDDPDAAPAPAQPGAALRADGRTDGEIAADDRAKRGADLNQQNISVAAASRGVVGSTIATGSAATMAAQNAAVLKREEEKKYSDAVHNAIKALEEENRRLQEQIDRNNEQIRVIDQKIDKVKSIKERLARGEKVGPEELKALGIDPTLSGEALTAALDKKTVDWRDQKAVLTAQNVQLGQQIQANKSDIAAAMKKGNLTGASLVARDGRVDNLVESNKNLYGQTLDNQRSGAADTGGLNVDAQRAQLRPSLDDEVGGFFRKYSQIEKIQDPALRQAKLKELVQGLSQDARSEVSLNQDTASLFDDNGNFIDKPQALAQVTTVSPQGAPAPAKAI